MNKEDLMKKFKEYHYGNDNDAQKLFNLLVKQGRAEALKEVEAMIKMKRQLPDGGILADDLRDLLKQIAGLNNKA